MFKILLDKDLGLIIVVLLIAYTALAPIFGTHFFGFRSIPMGWVWQSTAAIIATYVVLFIVALAGDKNQPTSLGDTENE